MKTCIPVFALALLVSAGAHAACCPSMAEKAAPAAAEPSKPAYPLTTCVVSGEKLGEMGDVVEYVHKEEGKPDRLVRFCCSSCIKKFKKDPAKYLAKLDEAEKAAAEKPAAKP